jgi:CRP-like cAMP-binding protein
VRRSESARAPEFLGRHRRHEKIVAHGPRTASVKALEPVTVLVVSEEALSDALGLRGWMGKFVRALAERFREAEDQLYGEPPKSAK